MTKLIFLGIFSIIFIYSILRPFNSALSKIYLIFGSLFGIILILFSDTVNSFAFRIGFEYGSPTLFFYVSLIVLFLLIFYVSNEFTKLNNKNAILAKELTLLKEELKRLKSN